MSISGTIYHRTYAGIRGVDLSQVASEISFDRFAAAENMWRDDRSPDGEATEVFPGFRVTARLPAGITALYRQNTSSGEYLLIHAGHYLYRLPVSMRDRAEHPAGLCCLSAAFPTEKGCGYQVGENFCLLTGGGIYLVEADGTLKALSEHPEIAYVPTVYVNGEEYEQRNLLTDRIRMRYSGEALPVSGDENGDGLLYTVYDPVGHLCTVRPSVSFGEIGHLHIPAEHEIDGIKHTVTGVAANAFAGNGKLLACDLPATLTAIGVRSFAGCTALSSIVLPDGLSILSNRAFSGCLTLKSVYIGKNLTYVGTGVFENCVSLSDVYFAGTAEEWAEVADGALATAFTGTGTQIHTEAAPPENIGECYEFPLHAPCAAILSLSLDGTALSENYTMFGAVGVRYSADATTSAVRKVRVYVTDRRVLSGRTLEVTARTDTSRFSTPTGYLAFGQTAEALSGTAAIGGCTLSLAYDGRIFLSGNPALPNTVFYSAPNATGYNDPLYFGELNYFNDGVSRTPNRALLNASGTLAVCKDESGGAGEIYYHTPAESGLSVVPRIYPSTVSVSGRGAIGEAVCYKDDPVFLCRDGVCAILRTDTENERYLVLRSDAVAPRLRREDLSHASVAVFDGYYYLCANGKIYLARMGKGGYDWYLLTGVGSYTGDAPVYRYTTGSGSFQTHPRRDERTTGEVYSLLGADGETHYYVTEGGTNYAVDTDGERDGGVFSPAHVLCATAAALFFGTSDGTLCCFNTDRRGIALYKTVASSLFRKVGNNYVALTGTAGRIVAADTLSDATLYALRDGQYTVAGTYKIYDDGAYAVLATAIGQTPPDRIPTHFYTYASHAYRAGCVLAADRGRVPHFSKDTVPGSAVLHVKAIPGSRFTALCRTDRHPWRVCDELGAGQADFAESHFGAWDFHDEPYTSLPLREKERGWGEKQLQFTSDVFRTAFGIFGLSYAYRVAGRIKD